MVPCALPTFESMAETTALHVGVGLSVCSPCCSLDKKNYRSSSGRPNQAPACTPLAPMQKQQALLGQMLIEGYGCEADPVQGKEWIERARRRGYRMSGVYCEL
jgi:hypothetical protein